MEILIELSLITINKQPILEEHVDDFVDRIVYGLWMPPIVVRRNGRGYILVDGRHRVAAYKRLGKTHIRANITL